jgi:uncharacterized RDD family membrane protein YckC
LLYILGELGISGYILYISTLILFFHLAYFMFFEILFRGQTPGKRCMKLRVIKGTGEPIGLFDAILRGFLRIAFFVPGFFIVDVALMVLTKKTPKNWRLCCKYHCCQT